MAVNGAQVAQSHFLENEAAAIAAAAVGVHAGVALVEAHFGQSPFEAFLGLVRELEGDVAFGHAAEKPLEIFLQLVVTRVGDQPVEIVRDRAHVLGNAPLVVVEDADKPRGGAADIVQGFKGNAVGKGGVAKNAYHVLVAPAHIPGHRHAQSGRQRGAGVAGAVTIMRAFTAQGKAAQSPGGANRMKAILAPGQQLMHIALMADIPDEFILGRRKRMMKREGQLDDAEIGAEMAAVGRQLGD